MSPDSADGGSAVLDTNVLVAAGFRPGSASGRLVEAVRHGRLVARWTEATRDEGRSVLSRIPPLRLLDLAGLFPETGRVDAPLDLGLVPDADGEVDRTLAALALATGAPLVTADRRLGDAARAAGAAVLSPADALRLL